MIATEPTILKSINATIIGSTQVSQLTTLMISMNIPIGLTSGCALEIDIPAEFIVEKMRLTSVVATGILAQSTPSKSIPFTI